MKENSSRVNVIESVQTPLGFFALVSLLLEATFGAMVFKLEGDIQIYALFGMIGTLILLIMSVTVIWYRHPSTADFVHDKQHDDERSFKFYKNQKDGNEYLSAIINAEPRFKKATIIQYSSFQVSSIVRSLLEKGVEVDLFLHKPETAISEFQRDKINIQVREYHDIYKNKKGVCNQLLKIFFYNDVGTVRAIKLDEEVLMLGYYTYTDDVIHGHDNPVFLCRSCDDKDNSIFKIFSSYIDELKPASKQIDICTYSSKDIANKDIESIVVDSVRVAGWVNDSVTHHEH